MNIRPYDPADECEEQEPFALDSLSGYSLKQELTTKLLKNEACAGLYESTRAKGVLPPLLAGRVAFEAALSDCSGFARLVAAQLGEPLEPLPFAQQFAGTLLSGVVKDIHEGRHVRWRCATMKGKDRLTLWCEHLLLNTLKPDGYPRESLLLCTDLTLTLPPLDNAAELLADLVGLFRDGLCRPLHFFPQASWLFLCDGRAKAEGRWNGTDHSPSPAESSEPSFALCWAGQDALDDEFELLAQRVYGPLRSLAVEEKTA
jgi:exodeoxyribonuclease V gamma subunit